MNRVKDIMYHSSCHKLPHSESKMREKSQPVKIARLLGRSGQLQSAQGNSTIKISLPEKITPYLKNVSTRKKVGTNIYNQAHPTERNVRRNLNFTEEPTTAIKTKKIVKTRTLNDNLAVSEGNLHSCNRKSLLLPPNTIKDLHIKNAVRQSKFVLPPNQTRSLITDFDDKYSKISKKSESLSSLIENTNAHVDSLSHVYEMSNKMSVIQHTSSQIPKVKNQSDLCSLYSDLTNINNEPVRKKIPEHLNCDEMSTCIHNNQGSGDVISSNSSLLCVHNMGIRMDTELANVNYLESKDTNISMLPDAENIKDKVCSQTAFKEEHLSSIIKDCKEHVHLSLQAAKTISDSNVNLQHNISKNKEHMILNETEIISFRNSFLKLEHHIYGIEKVLSDLKLEITTTTNTLTSLINNIISNNEIENEQQMTEYLNNREIMSNTETKSLPCIIIQDTEHKNTPQKVNKTLDLDLLKFSETNVKKKCKKNDSEITFQTDFVSESNKENQDDRNSPVNAKYSEHKTETKRRSARLMAKALNNSNVANDSFVNLENELDIINGKPDAMVESFNCTPLTNKYQDKKKDRPWKEYMALKSRMSCLLTPNIKKCRSSQSENNTYSETAVTDVCLSNKVLAELHNLYADSP